MTTVQGQDVPPHRANELEGAILQKVFQVKQRLKDLYEQQDKLFAELEVGRPYVFELTLGDGMMEWRTVVLGAPKGHWVYYKECDMIVDQKTTKADMAAISTSTVPTSKTTTRRARAEGGKGS